MKIITDKAVAYDVTIFELIKEGKSLENIEDQQVKYLNNVVECDDGKLKHLIKPGLGLKSMKSAYTVLKGFEIMHGLKKGQDNIWQYQDGIIGEVPLIKSKSGFTMSEVRRA